MKTLRNVLTGSRLAGTMLISFGLCSAVAHGQDATGSANPSAANPNAGKVLRIVVPFAAGGAREVLLRALHSELGAALGQTAIIDNRPGAGGAIGTAAVARAEPDGNTLIFAASSHNVTPLLSANAGYDPLREFVAVANVGMQSYVLMSSQQFAVRNVSELLREARAHPGKHNYSSAGIGSSTHLAMAYFTAMAGVDMMHIPYKSTQDATNDVLAGRTQALIVPNVGALPYLKDGRVRLLGVTSRKPSRFLPGVPAIADAGLPGYEFESWFGLLAPAKIPKAQIQRINSEVGRLLRQPQIIERLLAQGVEPTPLSPEAFDKLVRSDYEAMARVVKTSGARVD